MDRNPETLWKLVCMDYFLGASVFAAGALLVASTLASALGAAFFSSFLAGVAAAGAGALAAGAGAAAGAAGALAGSAAKAEAATRDTISVEIAFILVSFFKICK